MELYGNEKIGWPIGNTPWDPLHDRDQAMLMVLRFRLTIEAVEVNAWRVENAEDMAKHGHDELRTGFGIDLLHAICECVAKQRQARTV
jgi:hypothetical protein